MRTLLATVSALLFALTAPAEILVKSGEKIAFLGDSITAEGWEKPQGYVRLVLAGLAANGVKAVPIPAGIRGHSSHHMLDRLEKDVIEKKPDWLLLSCGINDVLYGKEGVPLNDAMAAAYRFPPEKGTYEKNVTAMLDRAMAAGIQPVLLTATVIKEDLTTPENKRLEAYNAFLRNLAATRKIPLADLNTGFHKRLQAEKKPNGDVLTVDGVHLNTAGNKLMATGVLIALGADAAERKKAQTAWAQTAPTKVTGKN